MSSFYKQSFVCLFVFLSFCSCHEKKSKKKETNFQDQANLIIKNIKVPSFPENTFNIMDYGAKPDAKTDNSAAFKNAINRCNESGGGKVLVPAGKFLTGPIYLKSNVNLHLEEGAEVLFTIDTSAYLPVVHTSYEGAELMNYSPLIYAYNEHNIAVTGKGTFNGQADNAHWWPWYGNKIFGYTDGDPQQRGDSNLPRLRKMNEQAKPIAERIFGAGYQLRPSFFQPFGCESVLVKGVAFINSPFWVLHPMKTNNITIDGVTVRSPGPNNDGCDPEYCKNVLIINCLFDTGDDCIAIKSGRNEDGRRVNIPSENIVIQHCEMKDGHGGIVLGSELSAGIRNVFVSDCKLNSPNLNIAIRIKTNTLRGGFVENLFVNNIKVGEVKEAVLRINTFYATYANQEGDFMPTIKNIHLENVEVEKGGKYGILIEGRKEKPVSGISLKDVNIKNVEIPISLKNTDPVQFDNTIINGVEY